MHQLLGLVKGEKLTTDMIFLVLASLWSGIESSQIRSFEPQPPLGKLLFNAADHLATPEFINNSIDRWLHLRCLSSHAYDPNFYQSLGHNIAPQWFADTRKPLLIHTYLREPIAYKEVWVIRDTGKERFDRTNTDKLEPSPN